MPKKFLIAFYAVLTLFSFVIFLGFQSLHSGNLEVVLLDIGQGDAIFIRTPQNQKILIDGGPKNNVLLPLANELSFFERKIDLLVITHPDLDHIAGLTEVLRRYEVENILMTGVQHETYWYQDILKQISKKNIPVYIANEELDFDFSSASSGQVAGVILDILWPRKIIAGSKPKDANFPSVVIRISYGETSALLTGDLEERGEKELLKTTQNIQSDILKLGHHGSRHSSSEDFLRAVNSSVALVSAGKDNQFGHPHEEVLERVKDQDIYSTIEQGSVRIVSDGEEWEIKF